MIDSKAVIELQKDLLKKEIEIFSIKPTLAVIQIEGDTASDRYIRNKKKLGEELGIEVRHILLSNNIAQYAVCELIDNLDEYDDSATGNAMSVFSEILHRFPRSVRLLYPNTILANIERYDGTSAGQEDIK